MTKIVKMILTLAFTIFASFAQAEWVQTSKGPMERLPLPNTEIYVSLVNVLRPNLHYEYSVYAAKSTGIGEDRFVKIAQKTYVPKSTDTLPGE